MSDYPNLWKRGEIQKRVRERANHRCEQCGMEFEEGTNLAITERRKDGHPMVGTCHHIDHDRSNNTMANLVYLCQRCHFNVHLKGNWNPSKPLPKRWQKKPPRWIRERFPILNFEQKPLFEMDGKS